MSETGPEAAENSDSQPSGEDEGMSGAGPSSHPARELSVHLLRMFETRMEAAALAARGEIGVFTSRLKLTAIMCAGIFFTVWGGIVLLAIALPEDLRVPVLGAVVGAFALLAIVAFALARKRVSGDQVGSMRWFVDSLRQDLELLSRLLASRQEQPPAASGRSPPHDLAA